MPKEEMPQTTFNFKKLLALVFVLLFIVMAAGFVWSFLNYKEAQKQILYLSSPEAREELSKKEIEETVAKVKKHIILPEEEPVVATIIDADSLKQQQAFYKDAVNGDKLLIYKEKAIIYNPTSDVLVNVGPVNIRTQAEPTAEEMAAAITVDMRNGSEKAGAARDLGDQIGANNGFQVLSVENAANTDYTGITLVNLTGKDVSALEQAFGVTASTALPEGEVASTADVVIIVGN